MKRLLRALLAATLFAAPVTSGSTLASAAVAFAQTVDEPEGVTGNPYYGPGWNGPANIASPGICPAWYGAHTPCVPATSGADER